jgi:glycosyltransferase involved in cell wall biosynthesis
MSDKLLSICIPTYNRVERLIDIVQRIVSNCSSTEIEIIVNDNASTDGTEKEIAKIKDKRLKYYKNKKNLGIAGNLFKLVERAKGDFLYIHWDDDYMEVDAIPWILKTIKANKDINQILGRIEDSSRENYWSCKELGHNCTDRILKPYPESWVKLLFTYGHGGGRILRKDSINLNYAKRFTESALSPFMHSILAVHPVLTGSTLCTSRTLYYKTSERIESIGHLVKNHPYWNPISSAERFKDRIQIVYDVIEDINARRGLFRKLRSYAAYKLLKTLYESLIHYKSFTPFFQFLTRILSIKEISGSPEFWLYTFLKGSDSLLFKSFDKSKL